MSGPAEPDDHVAARHVPDAAPSPTSPTATPWRRRVAGGVALLGGLILLLSMLAPWFDGGTYSDNAPEQIPAIGIRAVLALVAGAAAFVPRVSTPVSAAFLAAAGAAAGAGSLTMVGVLRDYSLDRLDAGWWMALGGQLLVGAAGLAAVLVAAASAPALFHRFDRRAPGSLVALCVGLLTTVLFVAYTLYLAPLAPYWAGVALVWGLLTLGVTMAAVRLEAATGRALLGGWAVGVLSYSVSDWVYRSHNSFDLNVIPGSSSPVSPCSSQPCGSGSADRDGHLVRAALVEVGVVGFPPMVTAPELAMLPTTRVATGPDFPSTVT